MLNQYNAQRSSTQRLVDEVDETICVFHRRKPSRNMYGEVYLEQLVADKAAFRPRQQPAERPLQHPSPVVSRRSLERVMRAT